MRTRPTVIEAVGENGFGARHALADPVIDDVQFGAGQKAIEAQYSAM